MIHNYNFCLTFTMWALLEISRIFMFVKGLFTCDEMRDSDMDVVYNGDNALAFSFLVTLARTTEA